MNNQEIYRAQSLNIRKQKLGLIPRRLRTGRFFSIAFSVLVLVLVLPCTSFAQSALTDDADTQNGNTPNLTLSSGSNVYLKFKLSSTLPANTPDSSVAKATIKLYLGALNSPGAVDVYLLSSNWSEKTITSAPPALGGILQTGILVQSDLKENFLVLDVTTAVQQWLGTDGLGTGGAPNYGVVLVARDGASLTFDSKENSQTSHEPQLNIQLGAGTADGTVTSVSADTPLSVTNPTTTPNISLGIVPAAKGGTGLNSPGPSGNFLRSDGGGWTSGPLSAADIPDLGSSYIRNATAVQSSNFNISGTGMANVFSAAAQYNLGADRVLSNPGTNNLFAGVGAGAVNTGQSNSFFGNSAGLSNTIGNFSSFFGSGAGRANIASNNSFFGSNAGLANTTGFQNSFFGREAGTNNTEGSFNSFFGRSAGLRNTTGSGNSLFGQDAGLNNTTGGVNAFFGNSAGEANTTGSSNSFFGVFAGDANTTGSNNTAIGRSAEVGVAGSNISNATAIGSRSHVTQSNSLVLGSINGVNNASADTSVGIGTTAPKARLDVTGGNILVGSAGQGIILKSPNGATCRLFSIDNAGALVVSAMACP